jgi:hypothetical protein
VPYTILKSGSANALTYNLSGLQSFEIESLNATLDTTGMVLNTNTACDVIYRDNAGLLIARSRSSVTIPFGSTVTMTFAPSLPDTQELSNVGFGYVNTSGLCATTLPPNGSVTVQPVDPLAVVKSFRMWVEDAVDAEGAGNAYLATLGPWALVPGLAA